jgi:hypothetical protein
MNKPTKLTEQQMNSPKIVIVSLIFFLSGCLSPPESIEKLALKNNVTLTKLNNEARKEGFDIYNKYEYKIERTDLVFEFVEWYTLGRISFAALFDKTNGKLFVYFGQKFPRNDTYFFDSNSLFTIPEVNAKLAPIKKARIITLEETLLEEEKET